MRKRLWEDILKIYFHPEELPDVLEKYENYVVISRLAVSTGTILRWFKKMNEGTDFDKQIKPFNFMLVGNGTTVNENGGKVKPIAPYSKNPQVAVENPFIDKKTGDIFQGREYWKPLSDVFLEYIDHTEAKFEGDVGILQRRYLKPTGCVYIGKEANKVEMQELEGNRVETYIDFKKFHEWVLALEPKDVREMGIMDRSTLKRVKDMIRQGKKLNYEKGVVDESYNPIDEALEQTCQWNFGITVVVNPKGNPLYQQKYKGFEGWKNWVQNHESFIPGTIQESHKYFSTNIYLKTDHFFSSHKLNVAGREKNVVLLNFFIDLQHYVLSSHLKEIK